MTSDSYIHNAPAHIAEPGHISQKSISFETFAGGQIVMNKNTTRYPQGQKQQNVFAGTPVGRRRGHS